MITAQGEKCWENYDGSRPWAVESASNLQASSGSSFIIGNADSQVQSFDGEFISCPKTAGALCTALYAFDRLDLSEPLVIAPGDFTIAKSVSRAIESGFRRVEADAFAVTMTSNDSRLSFVRFDSNNRILEFCEKKLVSNVATTGIFGFKTAKLFLDAAGWVLRNKTTHEGAFYVSSALNYFIMTGKQVASVQLDLEDGQFTKNWARP